MPVWEEVIPNSARAPKRCFRNFIVALILGSRAAEDGGRGGCINVVGPKQRKKAPDAFTPFHNSTQAGRAVKATQVRMQDAGW